jgi:hypothetical protein
MGVGFSIRGRTLESEFALRLELLRWPTYFVFLQERALSLTLVTGLQCARRGSPFRPLRDRVRILERQSCTSEIRDIDNTCYRFGHWAGDECDVGQRGDVDGLGDGNVTASESRAGEFLRCISCLLHLYSPDRYGAAEERGAAVIKFQPGSKVTTKAVFAGTNSFLGSTSAAAALSVTGTALTTT